MKPVLLSKPLETLSQNTVSSPDISCQRVGLARPCLPVANNQKFVHVIVLFTFAEVDLPDVLLCGIFREDHVVHEVASLSSLAEGNDFLCAVERVAPLVSVLCGFLTIVEHADAETDLDGPVHVEQVARRQEVLPVFVLRDIKNSKFDRRWFFRRLNWALPAEDACKLVENVLSVARSQIDFPKNVN